MPLVYGAFDQKLHARRIRPEGAGAELACSGAIYAAVPITIPICVAAAVSEIVGDSDTLASLASE